MNEDRVLSGETENREKTTASVAINFCLNLTLDYLKKINHLLKYFT
jgi:hypothetical protein